MMKISKAIPMNAQEPSAAFDEKSTTRAISATIPNQILAALPEVDLQRWMSHLERRYFPAGMFLCGASERAAYAYFLDTGVACRMYVTEEGETAGLALTGREGMIGIEAFLSGESMPAQSVMLCAGYGYRFAASELKIEFSRSAEIRRVLLLFSQALLTQIQLTAICTRHHSIEQRLCRFLLLCMDRLQLTELVMTQDLIANMLGVRREGITEATGKLKDAHLIGCRRGHISVLDRLGLEALTCECYAVVKGEYDRLASKVDSAQKHYSMQ
jgi:CRP-like cAMP-binding protein